MPEVRLNRITGEWVIIATERARRPEEFGRTRERKPLPRFSPTCPFCPGHDEMTPGVTFEVKDEAGAWQVRSVPNKYSALLPEGDADRHDHGLKTYLSGVGLHEVIIETPAHDLTHGAAPGRPRCSTSSTRTGSASPRSTPTPASST